MLSSPPSAVWIAYCAGTFGAQPHAGQQFQALQVVLRVLGGPGNHQPAGPEPGQAVGLGQAAEGEDHEVGSQRGDVLVDRAVVEDLVVDLVGQDQQVVLPGQVEEAFEDGARVDGAGRVVRVDDHQGAGAVGDLGGDVLEVGCPAGFLVAAVVHGAAAAEADGAGPERVVRARDQDLVAVVEEGLERHHDQLGHAVADEHVVGGEACDAAVRIELGHGKAGRMDAAGVAVTLGVTDVLDDIVDDRVSGSEPERRRVTQVELQDLVTLGLELAGPAQYRPPDVVSDVLQPAGLRHHDARAPPVRVSHLWCPKITTPRTN